MFHIKTIPAMLDNISEKEVAETAVIKQSLLI